MHLSEEMEGEAAASPRDTTATAKHALCRTRQLDTQETDSVTLPYFWPDVDDVAQAKEPETALSCGNAPTYDVGCASPGHISVPRRKRAVVNIGHIPGPISTGLWVPKDYY